MMSPRILIGDDHTLVRYALRRVLEDEAWDIVAEAARGDEAVRLVAQHQPDVAILDVGMPVMDGIKATEHITTQGWPTAVIILSMYSDPNTIRRALQAGARGYLLKDAENDELLHAVRAVTDGRSFFSGSVSNIILEDYVNASKSTVAGSDSPLSPRERQVLQLIGDGQTSTTIADALNIRPTTVETHRARILQKLGLRNTRELILWLAKARAATEPRFGDA
jgi:DNA-binding NarL/FixJ family response regulator